MKATIGNINCDAAVEMMSPFIDSMVTPEEAERLRAHLFDCAPCGRQLQSFISLRNLMAGSELRPVPEDLQLDIRVKLSRERLPNARDRWQARVDNILKPLAVPAFAGVAVTLMGFVVLLGVLVSPRSVQAKTPTWNILLSEDRLVSTYEPARSTTPTGRRFSRTMTPKLDQAISVQTDLSEKGLVTDYQVIGGNSSPDVDRWLQEVMLLAQFRPATIWGQAVPSRVILSFVNVRG
jgi:anti-sigma factor RsiW